ncbi:hypothetical protein [Natrinema sp. H-ect4]|uniref:hypothetical protein n=1 Tax=Natrinema sp. H-ect4 TaxID=3242699 RepID=UPI0035A8869C
MSSVGSGEFESLFTDTCILLSFTLNDDDGTAQVLLEEHQADNVVGNTVKREFQNVKERRELIVESIYGCTDLGNWTVPSSVNMSPNDRNWCAELLAEIDSLGDRESIKKRLSFEERKIKRGWDLLFGSTKPLIDDVWPNTLDARLLGDLRAHVDNESDRKVICECADWGANGGTGILITTDYQDIISAKSDIRSCVNRNRNFEEINIFNPTEFLENDPDYTD